MKEVSYLGIKGIRIAENITKGFSKDKKYRLEDSDGRSYLLRVSEPSKYDKKKACFLRLEHCWSIGLPVPEPVAFGYDNREEVYTVLSWIHGNNAKTLLPNLSKDEQYRLGLQAGAVLRAFHDKSPMDMAQDWKSRYDEVINSRLVAYKEEGIPFDGNQIILEHIENSMHFLTNRPQTMHHGDYHLDNMIINEKGQLSIIDWDTADFENIGDPWYEFSRLGTEFPAFATGQVDGYFNDQVPDDFWQLLAFYLAASAITSIVWAKYNAPNTVNRKIELNRQILRSFDGMNRMIPLWYDKTLHISGSKLWKKE